MKLGLVLECDVGGPDERVLTCFARRLVPGIKVEATAKGNKIDLFTEGVDAARALVEVSKCDLVLIVWDLKPYHDIPTPATSCEEEAERIRIQLGTLSKATRAKIRLLCLTWELETWFIADEKAVSAYLSTDAHKKKFKCSKPGAKTDPKAVLDRACKDARGRSRGYEDFKEAIRIACQVEQTNKLQAIPSFERFAELLTGSSAAPFQQTGDACKDLRHGAAMMGQPGTTSPAPLPAPPAPATTKNKAKPRRKIFK